MKKLFGISTFTGLFITVVLTVIVWEENPRDNIHGDGEIYWSNLLPIIFSSWILSTLACMAAFLLLYLIYRFIYHLYLRVGSKS